MKAILLHNWKAKIASLLLAMAIWYLIQLTIPAPKETPVPGTSPPPGDPVTPIPGLPFGSVPLPVAEAVVAMTPAHGGFFRLHWIDAGDFTASLVEFPARAMTDL